MKGKRSRSQNTILALLKTQTRAISAQDVYLALKQQHQGLGLATIYRALDALKLDGSVHVRTLASGESLYSLIQQDEHHLTCLHCGNSIPMAHCPVHHLEGHLAEEHDFKVYYHTLEFFGLCGDCQQKAQQKKTAEGS